VHLEFHWGATLCSDEPPLVYDQFLLDITRADLVMNWNDRRHTKDNNFASQLRLRHRAMNHLRSLLPLVLSIQTPHCPLNVASYVLRHCRRGFSTVVQMGTHCLATEEVADRAAVLGVSDLLLLAHTIEVQIQVGRIFSKWKKSRSTHGRRSRRSRPHPC